MSVVSHVSQMDDVKGIMQLNHALETKGELNLLMSASEPSTRYSALLLHFSYCTICHQGLEVHLCASVVIKVCFHFLLQHNGLTLIRFPLAVYMAEQV